ncbi:MAG: outer membrane beta-barrel protein [Tatlockia sp.]|nr:outer membrane beta-barrel protein [Tatlockia sp.]
MKKTIIASSVLASLLVCSTSFAGEEKPTGLYLKGFYDYSFAHRDNPSLYGLGAGYKFGLFRAEGQYSFGQHTQNHLLTARTHNFNAIGYLDLDNRTIFSPYVGLGFGYNDYSIKSKTSLYVAHGPTLLGTVGSRVYLNENFALDVGYKTNWGSSSNSLKKGNASVGLVYHFD